MSSTFGGFSEEDLKRIKSTETGQKNGPPMNNINTTNIRKLERLGGKLKRPVNQYKLTLQKQSSDDAIDSIDFQHCKLSIKTPTSPLNNNSTENVNNEDADDISISSNENVPDLNMNDRDNQGSMGEILDTESPNYGIRKCSTDSTPDIVRGVSNYTEDELAAHKAKLEGLQLKQKLMEEQNKKRKEMLAKALADRTKQTEEEVIRLEKIKKELQVLDGQFSQDVAVLRKRIDQACISYADAEKHYLKVEKDFLQAKISLQKEREKKELLTEHLCALITHNETRKAQKLETLMLELATDKKNDIIDVTKSVDDVTKSVDDVTKSVDDVTKSTDDDEPVIVDGVDQRTGKIVELTL